MFTKAAQSARNCAEKSFKAQDLESAIKYADTAKKLHPQFDGIDQLLVAYHVHVAASKKRFNGETDWYAVLGGVVNASTDKESIKKQFKKMAIMVHPDKNSSVAAEGAFKLISEAWNVLSDPTLRKKYDLRSSPPPPPSYSNPSSSAPPGASFGSRACPRCSRPCDYEDKKRSSINCPVCVRRYAFRTSSAKPPASSCSAEAAGFSTPTPCPCCTSSTLCKHDNAEGLSVSCPNCPFKLFVQSKHAWGFSFSKRFC
ncbi:hypothetical protein HHK36_024011 [Tetracentron sinense]|uniref:J domain-containing protein n=1 Tax=Tetracentron sinense TaxID=13715 RepID=A0A834YTJ7_TETSI|nr:hypothetical protein HHK36_024011 [Tetracentron sinense]